MNREELFGYKDNKQWVERRKETIEKEYENIQKMIVTYNNHNKQNMQMPDKTGENLEILLDMKIEALNFAMRLEKNLDKIDRALLKIKQPYRDILTDIYVNGESLLTVANHMNYSYKDFCTQHGKALKIYEDL